VSGLEEIDKMKSSTEVTEGVVTGAASAAATVAQVGATASGARVCDVDKSVKCDDGRASSPSPDNISGSTSAASKVQCTGLRGSAGRVEAPAAMTPVTTVTCDDSPRSERSAEPYIVEGIPQAGIVPGEQAA
jgi:hypothetical protein